MQNCFIGPCIAKKHEARDEAVAGNWCVLTFSELKEMFVSSNINLDECEESEFDPPYAMMGKAYPLAGGLKNYRRKWWYSWKRYYCGWRKEKVLEIIDEIANNHINAKFTDILFCEDV